MSKPLDSGLRRNDDNDLADEACRVYSCAIILSLTCLFMPMTKPDKQALIIGAGGGIGGAMTRLLLENGYAVFAAGRGGLEGHAALWAWRAAGPGKLRLLAMDMASQDSIEAGFGRISAETKRLHLVFNCTGLLHDQDLRPEKKLEDAALENLLQSFAVNAAGPLLVARYALPLLKHDQPSVLASMSARVGSISDNRLGGWYGYRASKAAQNMITKTLSIELARRSPNTICVGLHPGTVNTRLSKPFQGNVRPGQLKTASEAAGHLYRVIHGLKPADHGKVLAWDGGEIPP